MAQEPARESEESAEQKVTQFPQQRKSAQEEILQSAYNKIASGRQDELTLEEISLWEAFQEQQIREQRRQMYPQLAQFIEEGEQVQQAGGKRIFQITDTHMHHDDLERILKQNFSLVNFNPQKDIFVHTGDLLPDLLSFNLGEAAHGIERFLPEELVKHGELTGEDEKEFLRSYKVLLNKAGLDEESLRRGQVNQEGLQRLMTYMGGHQEPHFMTEEEAGEYRKNKKIFNEKFEKAVKNHARTNYRALKRTLENYGLNPDNFVLIGGNHDVLDVMNEEMAEYMVHAGDTKKVGGITFGNAVEGSTGQTIGPDFIDLFGYKDFKERLQDEVYKTKGFVELSEMVGELGLTQLKENPHLLQEAITRSRMRFSNGIGKGFVEQYVHKHIEPELNQTISDMQGKAASRVPDADIMLFHGMPNHPSYAGLEEQAAFEAVKKKGIPIMHGHIHENTSHYQGVPVINPGYGKTNFGGLLVGPDNKLLSVFNKNYNRTLDNIEFEHRAVKDLQPRRESTQRAA